MLRAVGVRCLPLAAIACLASVPTAWAADGEYLIHLWNTDRGLPQNGVNAVAQTPDGYLWVATFGGLARFDGAAFTTFTAANTPGLRGTRMTALLADRDGTLWIGTESDGLARYHDGRFTTFGLDDGLPGLSVRALAQDGRGALWVATASGLARSAGSRFEAVPLPEALAHQDVLAVLADRRGRLWAGTRSGVAVLDHDGGVFVLRPASGLPDETVTSLAEDADGTIWIGTLRGPVRWRDGRLDRSNPLPVDRVRAVHRVFAAAGAIWAAVPDHDLFRCTAGRCEAVGLARHVPDDVPRAVFADRTGTIWLGLQIDGLARLKVPRVRAYQVPGRSAQSIVPIVGDGAGGLWIGATCGGLLHWRAGVFTTYGPELGVPHDCIWSLYREPDGALWIGTMGVGAARWYQSRFTYFEYGKSGIVGNTIYAMYRDRGGRLWIGAGAGLSRFDGAAFANFTPEDGLPRAPIQFLTEDRQGAIWMGTPAGAVRFDGRAFRRFTMADGLPHDYVRAIYEDADGVLWFATYGGGLARYRDGRFATLSTRDGLFDDLLSIILEDDDGWFWMTSPRGIFRVARRDLNERADGRRTPLTSVSYGVADGMPVNEANGGGQPAGWRMADGRLFFPTVRGLVEIDPKRRRLEPPPVHIERVIAAGVAGRVVPGATLPAGSRDLEFHYTGIDLESPEKVRFRYRLDGYDAGWIDAGTRRVAFYTNVPAGRHTFRVQARSGDGIWNEAGASMAFAIAPHVHETWWFAGLVALALVGAVAGAMRLRVAQLTRRARALEVRVAERTAEVVRQKDQLAHANVSLARANQDLLSLLNELRVGAISTDRDGRIVFVSATAAPLVDDGAGRFWVEALPVSDSDRAALRAMAARPPEARTKLPVRMQALDGRQYWMEIDVKDDPRDPAAKIVFLYDVSEVYDLRLLLDDRGHAHGIIGGSAPMQLLQKQIRDVASVDTTVLIEGETGVGKELVARAIHEASDRRARPFLAVNCAGLTETLLTSQLFGHRRGAFTGATGDHVGFFEAAERGTIFLDEVGDMPPAVQMMLLRVLQEREITRVGESRARKIDVRVISATHRDLAAEVAAGRFRQDLLFRLRLARIVVPPLRDRRQDIPLLTSAFLAAATAAIAKPVHDISSEAMELLMRYAWPGNVRELKSAIESAVISARGMVIQASDLPSEIAAAAGRPLPAVRPGAVPRAETRRTLRGSEREQLEAALRQTGGNRAAAARLLGISRATFYRRLRTLGIDTEGPATTV